MDIVLIRHGESEANLINQKNYSMFTGQWECSLTMAFRHVFLAKASGGENYQDVCNRVEEFLCEIQKLNLKKIAVVSHMCTIRCILKLIQNLSEEETLKIRIKQCEPIILYEVFG